MFLLVIGMPKEHPAKLGSSKTSKLYLLIHLLELPLAKFSPSTILSSYSSSTKVNSNFAGVATVLENTVSRDGTTPNFMLADFDMNSFNITNLLDPTLDHHGATKAYVDEVAAAYSGLGDGTGLGSGWIDVLLEPVSELTEYFTVATKAILAATSVPSTSAMYYIMGRTTAGIGGGLFRWSASDNSAGVTADPLGAVYIPLAAHPTGSTGSFIRACQPGEVYAQWFADGAVTDIHVNAAIVYMGSAIGGGGTVHLPHQVTVSTSKIKLGNGSAGVPTTIKPVRLKGVGPTTGVGYGTPTGGTVITSSIADAAIECTGPMLGSSVEDVFIDVTSTSTSAMGLHLIEACFGSYRNITVNGCRGVGIKGMTYGLGNTEYNRFEQIVIYLPSAGTTAQGVYLNSTGSAADCTWNIFEGITVIPNHVDHTCIRLGYCDTNIFRRVSFPSLSIAAKGVVFDYTTNSDFPAANRFELIDPHACTITNSGSPSSAQIIALNSIDSLQLGNGGAIAYPLAGTFISRTKLPSNQTFYVDVAIGSDAFSGVRSSGPWATLQHAWDTIVACYDLNGFTATISVATGSYAAGLNTSTVPVGGTIKIIGGSAAGNQVVPYIIVGPGQNLYLEKLNISPSSGSGLTVNNDTNVTISDMVLGAATNDSIAIVGGRVATAGIVYYTGNGASVFSVDKGGSLILSHEVQGLADTTRTDFVRLSRNGSIIVDTTASFTGGKTLTGNKATATSRSYLDRGGKTLPGSSAGTIDATSTDVA